MKVIKFLAKVAAVFVVIGIVFSIISIAVDGRGSLSVINFNRYRDNSISQGVVEGEKVENIIVDFEIGEINIGPSNNDNIQFEYYGDVLDSFTFEFDEEEKTIKFENISNESGFIRPRIGFWHSRVLNIRLPREMYYNINVDSNISAIDINNINAKELILNSDIGAISVTSTHVNYDFVATSNVGAILLFSTTVDGLINITSDVGAVDIANVREPSSVNVQSSVGAISINDLYSKDVTLRSEVGSIDFRNTDLTYIIENLVVNSTIGASSINVGR